MSFKNKDNINIYAKQAMNSCVSDERQHLPLPNPGFDQCQALKQSLVNLPAIFQSAGEQMYAQCQVQANARSVPADDDAYTRICKPMTNRIIGQVIFVAMADLKARMDTAAAAGCPNNGYPESIHCDSYQVHAACVVALPEHPAMCNLDYNKAKAANIEQIWAAINTDDAPCTAFGDAHANLACPHPMQQMHCGEALKAIEDAWGPVAVSGITCDSFEDPAYEQLKQQAQQVLAAINADYQQAPVLHVESNAMVQSAPPPAPCSLARHDPLVISCTEGFSLEAIPERASAVYAAINADNAGGRPRPIYCLPDVDNDGAETPCLEGGPPPDLPSPVKLRVKPVLRTDGGGG
jgi:hypothetical protein